MKRKISGLLMMLFMIISLVGCGSYTEEPVVPPTSIIDDPTVELPTQPETPTVDDPTVEQEVEFVVSLVYNKKLFIPDASEPITVTWADDYSQYTQVIGEDGYARIKLQGDFNVYLDNTPKDYAYDPNIYTASSENPVVEIELLKVAKVSKGRGTALFNEYEISSDGVYSAKVTSKTKKVFYEYQPKQPGYYTIESLVNIYEDTVNPKVDIYDGSTQYKNFRETLDDGGAYKKGGYTKNFKWTVRMSQAELAGGVFTFAIYADSKTGVYPVTINFRITYQGEYNPDGIVSRMILPEEANFTTPEFSSSKYTYRNSDHGTGSYYSGRTNGTGLLDGDDYKYNEESGYWHLYDKETNTFGPILCASITVPCAYYEESLNMIESHGNKNLTVSNSTENYKQFIEVYYAAACNSDGVCYVTMELMIFLQKFSVSQRLFFDGNGFVESTGVYAIEEDQWLFACGYYQER